MANADEHADAEKGDPKLLERFREMNPDLREVEEGHRYCGNLYTLLTKRHRHEGHCPAGERIKLSRQCFMDHEEAWEDIRTGLPLIVAHAYCPQPGLRSRPEAEQEKAEERHRQIHREAAEMLAERGLAYRISSGSWYYPGRCTLVVMARADVAARVRLPELDGDQGQDDALSMDGMIPGIPWTEIMEAKLTEEAIKRDELAQLAPEEERSGDYQTAFMFYCDTALIDRESGFAELAREQLDEARRLITARPWLSIASVRLATEEDRKYVFGDGLPRWTRDELQEILDEVQVPDGWDGFLVTEDEEGTARATIWERGQIWGEARIEQGGNRNLWTAEVAKRYERTMSNTARLDDGEKALEERFIFESPEEAIQGAVKVWGMYDRLSGRTPE